MIVDHDKDENWDAGTWEGSRRAQLRGSLTLTVRERLEALEDMAEVSERLIRCGQAVCIRADEE